MNFTFLYKCQLIDYDYIKAESESSKPDKLIVFLHGFGLNKFEFDFLLPLLKNYNILKISLPNICEYTLDFNMWDYVSIVSTIIKIHQSKEVILICHSFGFRIATLLNKNELNITKIISTGGAYAKSKINFLKKLNLRHNPTPSDDYKLMPKSGRMTFKNIVNLDLSFALKNTILPTLLYYGKDDKTTPIYLAKKILKINKLAKLKIVNGDHFCHIKNKEDFKSDVLKFIKESNV